METELTKGSPFCSASELRLESPSPYIGILTYMISPALLALGILIFLYGFIEYFICLREKSAGIKCANLNFKGIFENEMRDYLVLNSEAWL
jgi:hypothetical protein